MARIHALFERLREVKGSDLHLAAGLPPRIRVHGALEPIPGAAALAADDLLAMLREIAPERSWEEYTRDGDADFAYGLPGVARLRANLLRQENGPAAVFRLIPERIVPLAELGLPPAIGTLAELQQGLVLVTGPTGSGKSTTLAAILDQINQSHARHVVTIEDPVEFVHKSKRSTFSQREVGTDTESFQAALRAAIRQDADVILVGEMRDLETISLAITAAEMGLLVFGTLHSNSAVNTIDRLVDVFPADDQPRVRTTLAESLAGIVAQILMATADGGGRCAAIEILLRTGGLANCIREGNTGMIVSIIQSGKSAGMQLMDDHLLALVEAKKITPRDAYLKATNKSRFEPLVGETEG